MLDYIEKVLNNMPWDWLRLTTHRLDIYDEERAKVQFLEQFELLYISKNADEGALKELPTAYDYIRLGHPLSCVLEWAVAKSYDLPNDQVISFSSATMPLLAVLRANLFHGKKTRVLYEGDVSVGLPEEVLKAVYGYHYVLEKVGNAADISKFDGSTILLTEGKRVKTYGLSSNIDFVVRGYGGLGSLLMVNGTDDSNYVSDIQHVRRRETIAMTPANCLVVLKGLIRGVVEASAATDRDKNKAAVLHSVKEITGTTTTPLVASSGLSMQYAIMMGLVHHAEENHKGKEIKFIVPPNCYGGTNDQARRVAACLTNVEVVDLPVDGDNDMVKSVDAVLSQIASADAVPYIIAEIPTNPRVEVPDLLKLKEALTTVRKTADGRAAIDPVFILDQTFCPNVLFLGEGKILSTVRAISYASGSKFPSGGKCTAGYCVANDMAAPLIDKIGFHLGLCDNEATALQYEILASQLPSMNQRIADAYANTRAFVNHIKSTLPTAKINFVSEDLASEGFTPSVFSLDLPTKGSTEEERESYKRALNHQLIDMMITEIPMESKYCVSYGQLKGCYWTIPATSTQGTTREGDKDYIARVALSADMDLDRHLEVFADFVSSL